MQSSLFESSLTDITGKIRLESEDPRWMQLFSSKSITPIVDGFNVTSYGNRLIEHNLSTGNLVQLLRQTSSRVQQVLGRKTAPPSQVIEQCCTALHLSTIMLHFVIITLSPQAVRSSVKRSFFTSELIFSIMHYCSSVNSCNYRNRGPSRRIRISPDKDSQTAVRQQTMQQEI